MDRNVLDVDELEPVAIEQMLKRGQRVVEEMLVVDRVELHVVHEIANVWRLDDRHAVVGEDRVECRAPSRSDPGRARARCWRGRHPLADPRPVASARRSRRRSRTTSERRCRWRPARCSPRGRFRAPRHPPPRSDEGGTRRCWPPPSRGSTVRGAAPSESRRRARPHWRRRRARSWRSRRSRRTAAPAAPRS